MSTEPPNFEGSYSQEDDHSESPFFADMTLDLETAHLPAATPEPARKFINEATSGGKGSLPHIPAFPEEGDEDDEESSMPSDDDENNGGQTSSSNNNNTSTAGDRNEPMQALRGGLSGVFSSKSRTNLRRYPRDLNWAIAFFVVVPCSLLFPMLASNDKKEVWMATATAPRLASLHTLLWGYVATLILGRILYRSIGGGDGDDSRHLASQILLAAAPISVSVYISLILALKIFLPRAFFPFAAIPIWYLARDLYLFRQWKVTSSTRGGRQAFFQALTCMTLDILSRSLRRQSLYRVINAVLLVQLGVCWVWRMALLSALRSRSPFLFVLAVVGGKWATGTVVRVLTLISAGGISSWFAEQSVLIGEMQESMSESHNPNEEMVELTRPRSRSNSGDNMIEEEYRNIDGSAYKPSLVPDEGLDDDFEDEEEDEMFDTPVSNGKAMSSNPERVSTVKTFLASALTVSFGSVAQCGLLGGPAQFLWSQVRKIDHARATFQGLQGMNIGEEETAMSQFMRKLNIWIRAFVRNHSDMAMSHVAAYQKTYHRAAQDVAVLVEEKGVEPIIHDDISTHMSACVGGSVSGIIIIFTGGVLVHQRNRNHSGISDSAIFWDMALAFILCYTLIFTIMEPLRASIKAVYVSFAQHPESLSQSFPLIFHRLSRMSQTNLS
jgi:hypothetical protein